MKRASLIAIARSIPPTVLRKVCICPAPRKRVRTKSPTNSRTRPDNSLSERGTQTAEKNHPPGAPHIAHFAMCGFSRRPGCIEITVKLGGKTLVLLSKRYYLTHKSNGAFSAHTFAKNGNVWATRHPF